MKAGDLQRPNSLLCFFACHVILMVHTDLQDGDQSVVVLRIARLFSRFIENQPLLTMFKAKPERSELGNSGRKRSFPAKCAGNFGIETFSKVQ